MKSLRILLISAALASAGPGLAGDLPADPFRSGMWESVAERYFPGEKVVFDQRVKVMAPANAENQFVVPVTVDASALQAVEEIVVVADLNPIQHALTFRPHAAEPFIGLRIKVEQTTPVRAGVRTADGVWHIGAVVVEAAGGGCSAPAAAHSNANWMATLGETRAMAGRDADGFTRLRFRMRHPMDTGLADGIPAFYLSRLEVASSQGTEVATIDSFEPVSENPTFTLKAQLDPDDQGFAVNGRDTEGNVYAFSLPAPPGEGN